MINQIPRVVLLAAVLFLGLASPGETAAPTREPGAIEAGIRVPRPCLVPPVPQKKGLPPSVGGPLRLEKDAFGRNRLTTRSTTGSNGEDRLRVLALMVDFEDEEMDSTAAYFERLLFFLEQFYEQVSDNQLLLDITLAPAVYRMPQTMSWYGLDDSIGVREATLAWDAVQVADPDIDFSTFDRLLVFHAGAGQESDILDDSREQVWSVFFRQVDFAYYLPFENASRGIYTDDRWAGGDTVFVQSAALFPETESQDNFVFSCVGVVCHEFGHGLGLPDLYDTVALEDQIYAESQGVGSWDLMASGTWNANGFVPGEFSAWSKVFLGWIEPRVVTSDETITLAAVETDRRGGLVKVPITGDEYFLIENRQQDLNGDGRFNYEETDSAGCFYQPSGSDSTLICLFDFYKDSYAGAEYDYWLPGESKGSGLLIWHIDDSVIQDNIEYNTVNAYPDHKGTDLEEADGIQDMDTPAYDILAFGSPADAWRAGNADRFAPDTEPNTDAYHHIASGITIDQISATGPEMTFRVSFGEPSDWPVLTAAPIGGNHVGVAQLDGDGEREIVVSDRGGNIHVLNPDATPAWIVGGASGAFRSLNTTIGTPLLADVNGDERTDLLVMADDGRIFGFTGPGVPLGSDPQGFLLQVERPAHGSELWAADLRPSVTGVEFAVGSAAGTAGGSTIRFYAVNSSGVPVARGTAQVDTGSTALPGALLPSDSSSDRLLALSVRSASADTVTGKVRLHRIVSVEGQFEDQGFVTASLPDSAFYSAPVVGDLNRDDRMDVVVTSSNGMIYALTTTGPAEDPDGLTVLSGWPKPVFASGNDGVSLADIDGNGYLEVLVIETGGVLHVFNYHGEPLLSLPEQIPSEIRYFIEPQLAPLVSDLTADGHPEIIVPLRDGQVFAARLDGSSASDNYAGGGLSGSSPAVEDLTGNGDIQLVTASNYLDGGRIDVHRLGRATGEPAWAMYRRSGLRDGAVATDLGVPVVNGPVLSDAFVMPNPARDLARIHYRVGAGVDEVLVEITDMLGRPVRSFPGSNFAGTDNSVSWDLTGPDGRPVSPGVYLARVQTSGSAGEEIQWIKFAVIR